MANYLELKNKHQEEVNNFPMVFAFSERQFVEAMAKLGLQPTDTDKIYSIGGGGFIRKTDSAAFSAMLDRHEEELRAAISADETGNGFIYDMFAYELSNHEFIISEDPTDALEALGLTLEEVKADKRLLHGFRKAIRRQYSDNK